MHRKALVLACFVLLVVVVYSKSSPARSQTTDRTAIVAILESQKAAWNRGDVDTFMDGYWRSPDVTFAGKDGFTRGWNPVQERYRKSYPDQATMGHVEFSELEVRPLGPDAALVLGRWHLKRAAGDVGGIFTLVFQKFPEGWRIVHDHTSAS